MKKNISFHLLTSDWLMIQKVSPSVASMLEKYFGYERIQDKKAKIDYYRFFNHYYCLYPSKRRGFVSLLHSLHVVACDLYRTGDFDKYMAFDALFVHLLRSL